MAFLLERQHDLILQSAHIYFTIMLQDTSASEQKVWITPIYHIIVKEWVDFSGLTTIENIDSIDVHFI